MKLNITRKLIISLLFLSVRFASTSMMVQLKKKRLMMLYSCNIGHILFSPYKIIFFDLPLLIFFFFGVLPNRS